MRKLLWKMSLSSFCLLFMFVAAPGVGYADYTKEMVDAAQAAGNLSADAQQQLLRGIYESNTLDVANTDIEILLMVVQQRRTELLDAEFKDQLDLIRKKNDLLGELNNKLKEAYMLDDADPNKELIIRTIQAEIDAISNVQQMEMLRLQALNNKRNEAFDLMTNFVKKMQDSRSSIISNMR